LQLIGGLYAACGEGVRHQAHTFYPRQRHKWDNGQNVPDSSGLLSSSGNNAKTSCTGMVNFAHFQTKWNIRNCITGEWLRGRSGHHHRGYTVALSFANENQSHVRLESLPKEFKKAITDERGDHGNLEVGRRENIYDCPRYTSLLTHARAFKFTHQEIGIKQEDDKTYFDNRSPDTFLHGNTTPGLEPRL
jgi:hypothetical protein